MNGLPFRILLIWAESKNGVIGQDNKLPWHIPEDLQRFKTLTLGKSVVMGRKTWESLPIKPLPGRQNIVISNTLENVEGATVVKSVFEALRTVNTDELYVIGGYSIFDAFLCMADDVYRTIVSLDVVTTMDTVLAPLVPSEYFNLALTEMCYSPSADLSYRNQHLVRIKK